MNLNKRIFAALLPIVALVAAGCGGGSKSNSVATVNGDPIGKDEFYKAMELKSNATVVVNPQLLRTSGNQIPAQPYQGNLADGNIGFETLRSLVEQRITLQLAADQGVSPTKGDIDAEIEQLKKDNPNYLNQLMTHGFTLEYFRTQIAVQLATEKILTKGIKISDADIDKYIKDNPEDALYYTPETVLVQYIVAASADKSKVDNDLSTGKPFALVAAQYSTDKSAAANNYHLGGDGMNPAPITSYEPKVRDIVEKTAEGSSSAWYPQGPDSIKFYVERKVAPVKKPIDAEIRKKISRQLAMVEGAKAIDLNKEKLDKLKASKIVVSEDILKNLWDQFDKQLRSQASADLGAAPTAPAASAAPSPAAPASPSPSAH